MVVEFLDMAFAGMEGAFLAHGAPVSGKRGGTAHMGGVALLPAALAGAAVGLFAGNQQHAAIGSALAGAAVPFFGHHRAGPGGIAMSAITSTAIGVVTQGIKSNWVQRETGRERSQATVRG